MNTSRDVECALRRVSKAYYANPQFTRRQGIALVATALGLLPELSRADTRGIDETGFVRIGGIDQWIGVQGRDVLNPVILFLHGGPAEAQSPFLKEFIPWETDFTVVNWDQRGSGQTYSRNGPSTPGMATPEKALERLIQDTRDVTEYVRKRLSKKKIILVGQSWGAILGLHVIKRWPELFYAFVGTGQPVSWQLDLEARERWAREQAAAANDRPSLKALQDAAALPVDDPKRAAASNKYRLAASDLEYVKVVEQFLGAPPFPTKGPVANWIAGAKFTNEKLSPALSSFDLRELGLDVSIPFFVIQGRDDHTADFAVAQTYMAQVHAPKKAFIPIAGGHYACFTDPTGFVDGLRRYVRPLAN